MDVAEDDVRAGRREGFGGRDADVTSGAGHHRDATLEVERAASLGRRGHERASPIAFRRHIAALVDS